MISSRVFWKIKNFRALAEFKNCKYPRSNCSSTYILYYASKSIARWYIKLNFLLHFVKSLFQGSCFFKPVAIIYYILARQQFVIQRCPYHSIRYSSKRLIRICMGGSIFTASTGILENFLFFSSIVNSKFCNSRTSVTLISCNAKFFPMQLYGP